MTELTAPAELNKVIQIDDEGYFKMDELRVADVEYGAGLLSTLRIDPQGRARVRSGSENVLVEAFDEPFVVKQIHPIRGAADVSGTVADWLVQMPYSYREPFSLETLRLDEWDRFHGRTDRGIPFVFSRSAQADFFNLVDDFSDDSITVNGHVFATTPLLSSAAAVDAAGFWDQAYQENRAQWELQQPSPALLAILPKLKLTPQRILVLGAGSAEDAAHLASLGHIVTAVDFSSEAIARAQAKHAGQRGLKFVQADFFNLPREMDGAFDLVFEHTCYCAISPERRADLLRVWRRALTPDGHLLGLFFTIDRPNGPPFGATEWELRARLGKGFRTLYWTRLRAQSDPSRYGMELLIYAQKLALT